MTPPSCAPAAAGPFRTPRCGSCARPGARCPNTWRCARACRCSTACARPTSSSRSRCSRSAATASTRPSSSATSSCRSRRSASTSTSSRASAPSWPTRSATPQGLDVLRPLEPDDVPYVTEAVQALTGELGGHAADRLRGRAVHPRLLPHRGRPVQEPRPHQGHDVRRAAAVARPAWTGSADIALELPAHPDRGRAPRRSSCSTPGSAAVPPDDYREFVLPHTRRIFDGLADLDVPRIHFGVGTGELLGAARRGRGRRRGRRLAGAAGRGRPPGRPRQGAAGQPGPGDPVAPWEVVERKAREVLRRGKAAEGHVFNLGHGVLPATDPDQLERLTDLVHEA